MISLEQLGITEKELEKLSLEEDEMRRSQWYVDECSRVKNIPNGWMDVTAQVQKDVISKYYNNEIADIIMYYLRRAHHIFPENIVFQNRIQVKYNRANIGKLKKGDTVPECIKNYLKNGVNFFVGSSMT
jgi:hypothetical protein